MRQKAFDLMVRNRLHVAKPATDIVIVDIDEKSLAAMAPDYGRWPWPRQVLAEFVEKIEAQQPRPSSSTSCSAMRIFSIRL
jgi:CHASE2 domain-containing sensor protein